MNMALSGIRVVLIRTSHPGNIGSAARAMKTMGLSQLYLVNPARFPDPEAVAMSSHAADVLASARVVDSLQAALSGSVLQIAFSARNRAISHIPADVREAAVEAAATARSGQVALVFGNETYGMSNEEVIQCNRLACIPAEPGSTSLNLGAAVQVAAYELRMAALEAPAPVQPEPRDLATHEDMQRLFVHLEQSIMGSGFLQPDNPRRLMERIRRLFSRNDLDKEEVNILRGMLTAWDAAGRARGRGPGNS